MKASKSLFLVLVLPLLLFALANCTPTGDQRQPEEQVDPKPEPEPEPTPDPEPDPIPDSFGAYKRVIILGIDGAGAFIKDTSTPAIDKICAEGAITYRCKVGYPTISAQGWGSILHGVLPEVHRLTNDYVSNVPYDPESLFPSIFRVVREAMPDALLASFCNWNPINFGIIEDNLGVYKETGNDAQVMSKICSYLSENSPTLLFSQFDSVDGAGHKDGFGSSSHLVAISTVDAYIGSIYNTLEAKGLLDGTLIIICTDHGGTPEGSHGGDSDAERYVFLGIAGKTVDGETGIIEAELQDIPAIVTYALGLKPAEYWTSRVPTGVFLGVKAQERKEIELPESENRKHETEPTPDIGTLKTLLEGHETLAYLPFDSDAADAFGQTQTQTEGKVYYYDAYFGKGIALDDGYVTLKDASVGEKSFSASFWMKTQGTNGDPCLLSNKDWNSGANKGFVLSLRPADIKFNAGRGESVRMDITAPLPFDYKEGWMHVILTVDREQNVVKIYNDFKLAISGSIPEGLQDASFDCYELVIGQDGTGNYSDHLPAQIDEMLILADVLEEDDISALKSYYHASSNP